MITPTKIRVLVIKRPPEFETRAASWTLPRGTCGTSLFELTKRISAADIFRQTLFQLRLLLRPAG